MWCLHGTMGCLKFTQKTAMGIDGYSGIAHFQKPSESPSLQWPPSRNPLRRRGVGHLAEGLEPQWSLGPKDIERPSHLVGIRCSTILFSTLLVDVSRLFSTPLSLFDTVLYTIVHCLGKQLETFEQGLWDEQENPTTTSAAPGHCHCINLSSYELYMI